MTIPLKIYADLNMNTSSSKEITARYQMNTLHGALIAVEGCISSDVFVYVCAAIIEFPITDYSIDVSQLKYVYNLVGMCVQK